MTAILQALSSVFRSANEADPLTQLALYCGAGLVVFPLLLIYRLVSGLFHGIAQSRVRKARQADRIVE